MDKNEQIIEGEYVDEAEMTYPTHKKPTHGATVWETLADFAQQHPIVTTILEYIPSPLPWWGWGDYLGMIYAMRDLKRGYRWRGGLKMAVAVVPLVPTRLVQGVIDGWFNKEV